MNNDKRLKAYALAKEAAKLDFESALQGLVAGQEAIIEELKERASSARFALTQALCLTGNGVRGDMRETFVNNIITEIGKPNCGAEKEFISKFGKEVG